ncbi:MAG: cell wall hydrolase [Bacillota bacterium]
MNKLNWITLILFVACFTLGLLGWSSNDNENPENVSSETGQGLVASYNTDIDEERALLIERNEQNISRGSEIRSISNSDQAISSPNSTKSAAPVTPVSSTEAKPAASTEVKPAAPKEVKPAPTANAEPNKTIEPKQSAPEKAATESVNNLDLLARLITAEAQGEPYEAKVAVGAVVMNRVESNSWPNTIKEVIYQNINGYYQFSPVVNGWINKPAQPESIEAAKAALGGVDPTNGAQFYYDDTTTNPWILEKPVSIKIGHMIYAF